MKKILALLMVFVMVISNGCITALAGDTNEADSNLIYDLDLSSYVKNGTVSNAVAGEDNDYFSLTTKESGKTEGKIFKSESNDIVPYIALESTTNKLTYSTTDSDMVGKSYTLEAWVQLECLNSVFVGYPFMAINSGEENVLPNDDTANLTEASANVAVGFISNSTSVSDSGNSDANIAWHRGANWQYSSHWMHSDYKKDDWVKVTLVREVVKGESQDTIKKRLYINGANKINGYEGDYWNEFSYQTEAPLAEELLSFNIGSFYEGEWAYPYEKVNIADVKLYNDVRTESEISADYEAEKGTYKFKESVDTNLIYDLDLSLFEKQGAIVNAVGNDNYFGLTTKDSGTISAKKFNNADEVVPYIALESTKNKLTYSTTDSDMVGKSYTLEAWVQLECLNSVFVGYPFMAINSGEENVLPNDDTANLTEASANVAVGFISNSTSVSDSGNSDANIAWHRGANWQYSSHWMHSDYKKDDWVKVTLVREVVKGESQDTIKKRLYINGANKINGYEGDYWNEFSYQTEAPLAEELLSFNIGSFYEGEWAYPYEKVNIADVKLYNDVRTSSEISADYEAEKGKYIPVSKNLEDYLYYQTDLESYNPPVGDGGEVNTGYISNALEGSEGMPYLRQQGFNGYNRFFKEIVGIGKELNPVYRAVNDRMSADKYYLKDAALAGEDILVSAWLEFGAANISHWDEKFLAVSGWDLEDNEINQANLMICGEVGYTTAYWKYGNTAQSRDFSDSDNCEKLVHIAIIRDVDYNKVTNYYYRNGELVATEVLDAPSAEATAGIELCPGYRKYLHTYDVKVYSGKSFASADVASIYNAELGSFETATFTLSSDYTITDKNDAAITDGAQLADGFKFSTGVEGNGMSNAVVALYEGGRLCDMQLVEYNKEAAINATFDSFGYNADAQYSIKVMLLDSLTRIYPMAAQAEYTNIFAN